MIPSRRVHEHALSPATKIDEDSIPAPRRVPTTRRHIAPTPFHVSRLFSSFLLYFTAFTHLSTPPRITTAVTFSARSPVRRCATICHVVIFRRPHMFPHRLCCVLLILFYIYFAFMFQNMLSILFHMITYILHTNYGTQSSYKNTVELLHKEQEYYALNFVSTSRFRPRARITS